MEFSPECQKLLEYEQEGYVFHGSPNPDIEALVPRTTNALPTDAEFNRDTAVFATQYPTAAAIFGAMSLENVPRELLKEYWSLHKTDDGKIETTIPESWKNYVIGNSGYVYVLKKDSFSSEPDSEGGWQLKSKEMIKPVDAIKVVFSDFEEMGGVIIWK